MNASLQILQTAAIAVATVSDERLVARLLRAMIAGGLLPTYESILTSHGYVEVRGRESGRLSVGVYYGGILDQDGSRNFSAREPQPVPFLLAAARARAETGEGVPALEKLIGTIRRMLATGIHLTADLPPRGRKEIRGFIVSETKTMINGHGPTRVFLALCWVALSEYSGRSHWPGNPAYDAVVVYIANQCGVDCSPLLDYPTPVVKEIPALPIDPRGRGPGPKDCEFFA